VSTAPRRALNDGHEIPALGFGTWPLDDAQAEKSIGVAIAAGYRLLDSAARYGNERGVGRAVRSSAVPRDELFVTTKLAGADHGRDQAIAALEASLGRLGLDYVDLYLIHWPLPRVGRYVDAWRGLIELRERGLARSIGVSNFTDEHVLTLIEETDVVPAVNQVELHPAFAQADLRMFDRDHGIVTESWSPLGQGGPLLRQPAIRGIAAAHGVTPAQVVLRWHVDVGAVPIPKSGDPERMASNLDVFGFDLSADELAALAALDSGRRLGGDPTTHEEF
jgi:2,5-diketo-D-gluconate reductase A